MLLSIIIPIYNTDFIFVEKCLAFLNDEGVEEASFETIIVDDGSDDEYFRRLEIFVKNNKYPVSLFKKENGGQNSARNYGLQFAKGKFILFLDSDDVINIKEVMQCVVYAEKENADLCIFEYSLLNDNFEITRDHNRWHSCKSEFFYINKDEAFKRKPNLWGMIIRKSLFLRNHFYLIEGVRIAEDLVSAIILINLATKIIASKHKVYGYVQRATSIINNVKPNHLTHTLLAFEKLFNALDSKNIPITKSVMGLVVEHVIYYNGIRTIDCAYRSSGFDLVDNIKFLTFKKMRHFDINWRLSVFFVNNAILKNIDFWLLFVGLWKVDFVFNVIKKHVKNTLKL